ncbi:MAG: zinc ribbon domain-containing protein [Rhodocyclaceae bacterium]|nr:zinc ribbon domain-containing protein [Rhodocyclaceae bacterium]
MGATERGRQLLEISAGVLGGALDGLRRPVVPGLLFAGLLVFGVAVVAADALAMMAESTVVAALSGLLIALLAMSVANAAGVAMMDRVGDHPRRSLPALLFAGARALAMLIVVALITTATLLAFALAAAALLRACWLPIVGPVLLVVLLPALISGAAVLVAGAFATLLLAAPAFWSGQSLRAALTVTLAGLRRRPIEILLAVLLLFSLAALLSFGVGVFYAVGSAIVAALASAVAGVEMAATLSADDLFTAIAAGEGQALAAAAGMGILLLLGLTVPLAAQIGGLCHIHRMLGAARPMAARPSGAESPHVQPSQAAPTDEGLSSTLKTVAQPPQGRQAVPVVDERPIQITTEPCESDPVGRPAGEEAVARQSPVADPAAPPPESDAEFMAADAGLEVTMIVMPGRCPACHSAIESTDQFCGECGHRLTHAQPDATERKDG